MILTRSLALGAHAFFAPEGAAYAAGQDNNANGTDAGVVDSLNAPASDDDAFIPLGAIEEHEDKPKDAKTVTAMIAAPAVLVPKRIVTVSQGFNYNFTTSELTPMATQIFYRAGTTLAQATTQFVPLAGKPLHGFLLLEKYSTEGDQNNPFMVALLFVFLEITGGFKGSDNSIIKPTWEAQQMYSPLNSIGTPQEN